MRWDFWRPKRRDADLDDEIAHDLASEAEENVTAGMARDEAERRSRRDFGNTALVKENMREAWGWTSIERLWQDAQYALRTFRKNPLFTAMAVLSLALGIGANTAIYSFMDAILMRALPVQSPGELVIPNWQTKSLPHVVHGITGTWHGDGTIGFTSGNYPYPAFDFLQANNSVLSHLFAYAGLGRLNMIVQGQAELANGLSVSGGFFNGLGVSPVAGRLISDHDDRMNAEPVVVISHGYWQRRFGANPGAVGQSILINSKPFTVAGVSQPGFSGVDPGGSMDFFISMRSVHSAGLGNEGARRFIDKNYYWAEMMGRLRPGIRLEQADAELSAKFRQYVESTASTAEEKADLPVLRLVAGGSGVDSLRRQYSKPLYVLMSFVGLILGIGCANIASLLLARASARRREIAVRLSLGASRLRIIRQLLTESVMLSLAGGALGVAVGAAGIRFITWLLSNGESNFTLHAELNWPVLGFTLALALVTGLLFGLAPAVQATKVDVTPALKEARASATPARLRLSKLLVVAQIALSLLLVVAAGLFVRTLTSLNSVELGFNRQNLLVFSLNAKPAGYEGAALASFYAGLRSRLSSVPGVRSVSISDFALVSGAGSQTSVNIPGVPTPPGREPATSALKVGPDFLSTMQIPVMLGREIQEHDIASSAKVVVVNEVFAKKYFGGRNPVGRRFGFGESDAADVEIVGVARNSRYNSLKRDIPPVVYHPYTLNLRTLSGLTFELRTDTDPAGMASTIGTIVREADSRIPVSSFNTQSRIIDETINQERTLAQLCGCFAALALLISTVGLYGTMAYSVARRTSEIGIRMALGAARRRVVWTVLSEALRLTATGVAIGTAVVWGTSRYLESFLYGVKPRDAVAMCLSVLILAAVSVLAGYFPAARASRIDPMTALRHE